MEIIARGPNLPPRVVGSLQGYFNIRMHDCKVAKEKNFDTIRIVFWGLPVNEVPQLRIPTEERQCTVVCPVVTEWPLFEEYCRMAKAVSIEVGKRNVVWKATLELTLPLPLAEKDAQAKQIAVVDEFKDVKGHIDVMFWADVTAPAAVEDCNKRRRLVPSRPRDVVIDSIADLFDVLEKNLTTEGLRLIDVFRFCNKLNTPVADLTSLIDRYVDRAVPIVHRNQFWNLIDPKGSRIFSFAVFNQKFKNAKRAMSTVLNDIKMEVTVATRFEAVYKDLTKEEHQQRHLYSEIEPKTLIEHLKRCAPDALPFDESCLLATIFLRIPKQNVWTLEELRAALKMKPLARRAVPAGHAELTPPADRVTLAPTLREPASSKEEGSKESSEENGEGEVQETANTASSDSSENSESSEGKSTGQGSDHGALDSSSGSSGGVPGEGVAKAELGIKSQVLKEVLNTVLPSPAQNPDTSERSAAVEDEQKENLTELVDGLILKCQGLMRNMTICGKTLCASTAGVEISHGVTSMVASDGGVLVSLPSQRPARLGLPDDPELLTKDLLCNSILLQSQLPLAFSGSVPTSVKRVQSPAALPRTVCKLPLKAKKAAVTGLPSWTQLVVHRWLLEGDGVQVDALVKSKGFSKRVERIGGIGGDVSIWIPFHSSDSFFHLVMEVRSRGKEAVHGVVTQATGQDEWLHCSNLIGVVKVCVPMDSKSGMHCLLDHVACSIMDLSGEEKGKVEMSLYTSSSPLKPAQALPDACPSLSKSKPVMKKQTSDSGEGGASGQPLPDNSSSARLESVLQITTNPESFEEEEKDLVDITEEEGPSLEEASSREVVQVIVERVKLDCFFRREHSVMNETDLKFLCSVGCYLRCSLEKESATEYRSPVAEAENGSSTLICVAFNHSFPVPEVNQAAWFDQSLILKVVSVSDDAQLEEVVGELQLDLPCVPRFGRICGPMGLVDRQLKKTGEIEVDIQLLAADVLRKRDSMQHIRSSNLSPEPATSPQEEETAEPPVPFQTCSDDENYFVVGGVEDELPDSRYDEIDELCDMFLQASEIEDLQNQMTAHPLDPTVIPDPFHCDDDFMLDISKHSQTALSASERENVSCIFDRSDKETREAGLEWLDEGSDDLNADAEEIPVIRISSDCLGNQSGENLWRFTNALPVSPSSSPVLCSDDMPTSHFSDPTDPNPSILFPCTVDFPQEAENASQQAPVAARETDMADENDSTDSVNLDDLLMKYNIERRPGWWKSLMTDDATRSPPC